jgi:two-component system phosphate regulon sensor histidine kinase PhoR
MEDAEKNVAEWKENSSIEISKLKEQAAFRKEFLGNLAHELKTPVFSIQGYLLTLLDGGLEDPNVNRAFLERASKSTDRITGILEDLDQITRMETENLRLEIRSFDIIELLKESFETFELIAKEKNYQLLFEKSFTSKYVQADRNKLGQVFTNLISKYVKAKSKKYSKCTVKNKFADPPSSKSNFVCIVLFHVSLFYISVYQNGIKV